MIDTGSDWAFVAPSDELLNNGVFRFGDDFNPAIGKVLGAAFDAEMLGLVLGEKAKVDALNSTGNQDFNFTHHSFILQQ
jgi:hypothetical protein